MQGLCPTIELPLPKGPCLVYSYQWKDIFSLQLQPGPLKISSIADVMKESKQPTVKTPKGKPEVSSTGCEEKEGNF